MRRALPLAAAVFALLLVGWWGVEIFTAEPEGERSRTGLGDDPDDVVVLDRPGGEPAAGAPLRVTPTERPRPKRPRPESRGALDDDGVQVGRLEPARGAGAERHVGSVENDPVAEGDAGSPASRPGRVVDAGRGDGLLVSNTWNTGPQDEVDVSAGYAWIGTPPQQVQGMLAERGASAPPALAWEAPRHAVWVDAFRMERYELTNARYLTFLVDRARVTIDTPFERATTLLETVVALVGDRAPVPWNVRLTARQCYEANAAALERAFPAHVVRDADTRLVDRSATFDRIVDARLPAGVRIRFFNRAPPPAWPSDTYALGRGTRPVHGVTLADATALSFWTGKHLPTELEWEYAARGPKGWDVPWGAGRQHVVDRVNGGRIPRDGEVPETLKVTALPESASWVGCQQVLGNVAEWTSSWLDPYPGSAVAAVPVPVQRGGSAWDTDPLRVRSAYRGTSEAPHGAGTPGPRAQRFGVGIRLARYLEPARSRLPGMHTYLRLGGDVDPTLLETTVYAGIESVLDRTISGRVDAGARRGVMTLVVQPLATVGQLVPTTPRGQPGVPSAVETEEQLIALSTARTVLLGLVQTDLRLEDAWAVTARAGGGAPRRDKAFVPPGVWILVLQDGYLGLTDPTFASLFTLTRGRAKSASLRIRTVEPKADGTPRATASLERPTRAGRIRMGLKVPLNLARPELLVQVRLDAWLDREVVPALSVWSEGRAER